MAKKRFSFKRRAKKAFKSYRRSVGKSGSSANLMTVALCAGVYGAARPKIEEVINPYTSKIPVVGNYADELVLGTAGYFLAKGKMPFLKGKVAKSAGLAILTIESARVGSGLAQGMMPSSTSGSNFDAGNW